MKRGFAREDAEASWERKFRPDVSYEERKKGSTMSPVRPGYDGGRGNRRKSRMGYEMAVETVTRNGPTEDGNQ